MTVLDLHPSNCCMVELSEDRLWSSMNCGLTSTCMTRVLKDKLKQTCELARGELRKSHEKYRIKYNRKATRNRTFKVGDEVALLLLEINC